jgi:hypothetical protein
VHHSVVAEQKLIEQNYKLMQLYSPSLPVQTHNRIREVMDGFEPEFNKSGLRAQMHKDGIGEVSLTDLFVAFNRFVSDYRKSA